MKIAFIEPVGKGGMIHYAFQLCRGLQGRGAEVTLITDQHYELAALQAPFHVEPMMKLWDARPAGGMATGAIASVARKVRRVWRALLYYKEWLRVIRRVGKLRPDVVLLGDVRFPFDLFALMLLRRKAKFMADICHNVRPFAASGGKSGGNFDASARNQAFYKRIYRLFDAVFVHFDRNRREFVDSFGIPDERVGVIVHGNEAVFGELRAPGVTAATIRARLGIEPDQKVVLFFGLLSKYKGTDILLSAFPRIHRETGARLVLAGFPSPEFDLDAQRRQAKESGIENAVTWVPQYIPTEEVAAWMEMADAAIFPYRDIYQSGALHVAQTFGVPIVASAIRAFQDVIEHEVSGLLVPSGDVEALADAIVRILKDDTLAQRLGQRAAQDAGTRFGWDSIAGTILEKIDGGNHRDAEAQSFLKVKKLQ